ncbi:MAG: CHAT domain-containing protein [Bryobacterales bacterium]|nr:CHAT domain-containing protein [Bryobacterales bacterium]
MKSRRRIKGWILTGACMALACATAAFQAERFSLAPGEARVHHGAAAAAGLLDSVRITVEGGALTARLPTAEERTLPNVSGVFRLSWVVKEGPRDLEIRSSGKAEPDARYRIEWLPAHAVTAADQMQLEGEAAFEQAQGMRREATERKGREAALGACRRALALAQQTGDETRRRVLRTSEGQLLGELRQFQAARAAFEEALEWNRRAGDARWEALTLYGLGRVELDSANYEEAIRYLERTLIPLSQLNDAHEQARVLHHIGVTCWLTGESPKAMEYYERALALRRNDPAGTAYTLYGMGAADWSMGEYQDALDHYQRALRAWRELRSAPDPGGLNARGEANTRNSLGLVYAALGSQGMALEQYEAALAIWRGVSDTGGEAYTKNNMGLSYLDLGRVREAGLAIEAAQAPLEQLKDLRGQAYVQQNLGDVRLRQGKREAALVSYEKALALKREIGDRWGEAHTLHSLGEVRQQMSQPAAARRFYEQALELRRSTADRAGEALTLAAMAALDSQAGELKRAGREISGSLDLIERTRTSVARPDLRSLYFTTHHSYYEFAADLYMRLHAVNPGGGFDRRAFDWSERARARALLDSLANLRAEVSKKAGSEAKRGVLLRRFNAQADRLVRLEGTATEAAQIKAARKKMDGLIEEYRQWEANARGSDFLSGGPRPLEEIQRSALGPDVVLLQYMLGRERSYLWVVTQQGLESFTLPPRKSIEAAARELIGLLTARNQETDSSLEARQARLKAADGSLPLVAARLRRMLLNPAARLTQGKRTLLVSGAGILRHIPFAALEGGGARHSYVYLPSASSLVEIRRREEGRQPAEKGLAVVADPVFTARDSRVARPVARRGAPGEDWPRLRHSIEEARAIAPFWPADSRLLVTGFDATREMVEGEAFGQYRYIHLATHAVIDEGRPELSRIILSQLGRDSRPREGNLRLFEIYNLRWKADLVVLSACRSALGKDVEGEGLVGLATGFLQAGVPRLAASLWDVDDRATTELMKHFYESMLRKKMPAAAALAAAQEQLRRIPRWSSPYYWAPFILIGEWN